MAGNSSEPGQSVAGRLLRVLDAFTAERPELSLSDMSRRTGLPPATLHRLLRELTEHGAVERTSTGRYAVGLRLWEIGRLASRTSRLDEVATPYLENLHEATRGDLHLAVPVRGEALYVLVITGDDPVRPLIRPGSRDPLTSSCVGQVLLAHAAPDVLESLVADRGADGTFTAAYRIRQLLADIRRCGVAMVGGDGQPFSVAAAVRGPRGTVVAALSLTVRTVGEPRRLVRMVRVAADVITRELGAPAAG